MNSSLTISPTSDSLPSPSPSLPIVPSNDDPTSPHSLHPVVAFIIGLSIILGASLMNAGGLNITKLDHSRQASIPKSARRRDWLRPLWLLGMLLYILSQLVGSTLALEFMRAEYVAPLGSTSLIFNFLFANLLIGTPVTSTDIYGTVIIVFGVIGIVLFGSINSGLWNDMDIVRLATLWSRAGWVVFFLTMSLALVILYVCTSQLEAVLSARADLSAVPFSAASQLSGKPTTFRAKAFYYYKSFLVWVREWIEHWTAAKTDKEIAWTLGIGWACCGGGLAGGCLVFAKSCVKLISGSLSHQNTGNQFAHPAAIFTFLLLGLTAVFQIICLNRGLRVYDSTLVVPVFYGVYTASGFLNSLIFNDEVDSYQSWTLFLIFVSITVLIGGVVLLTHEKPEQAAKKPGTQLVSLSRRIRKAKKDRGENGANGDNDEEANLHEREPGVVEEETLWQVGDDSDEEDADGHEEDRPQARRRESRSKQDEPEDGERSGLMREEHNDDEPGLASGSSSSTRVDDFGDWNTAGNHNRTN
ncbi:hypothetical protein M422DRAFT_68829 [Sphaerobolus stellatus SS14]|uniref:Magnesium transporter n=1 Tax=Sphaerobolus stellatus (strain SS14) TaxID=990650 RepID=A0A0C9VNA0_SPHS4|nr:hypothetical protein M422DRAFT_68829 [Sphaerobolus stellatus SS14]